MKLRTSALVLGAVTGFVFSWARLTDPETFRRMLSLDSPDVYLLMGAAVAVAFVGARIVRGRRTLLGDRPIEWRPGRVTSSHVVGSVLFGIGWGVTDACPGPTAAQLGGGRVLSIAVAGGIVAGVWLQPAVVRAAENLRRKAAAPVAGVQGADVL